MREWFEFLKSYKVQTVCKQAGPNSKLFMGRQKIKLAINK